ncbi:MAG: RNA polymerase sigma factor [candidate division Zixibacteria bacterium]
MNRHRDLFWKLVEPEHVKARAFCRKLTNNRDDGDDLYQDSLVKALTQFERLESTDSFRPWLYRIIVNSFRNRVKSPWWKKVLPSTPDFLESVSGEDPTSLYTARRRLEIAFRAVEPVDRALITLFEMQGWTIAELAEMKGLSQSAVKMRLSRCRRKMRQALMKHLKMTGSSRNENIKFQEDKVCVVTKPVNE